MIENKALVYVRNIGRPPSTGRALNDVPIAAITPFSDRGGDCNVLEK